MDTTIRKRPANTNIDTGIPFGVIALDKLDQDVVEQLLYGRHAKNLTYEEAKADYLEKMRVGSEQTNASPYDEARAEDEFADQYEADEECFAGEYEGVQYQTFWLGGAQLLFVFKSPIVSPCAQCSPCVPNAGSLGTVGSYEAYDVPASWLRSEE